jgi:hypothetical protein
MTRNHGKHHNKAYRVSIDLSSFRDDDRSCEARKYREVLTSLTEYDGKIRDIESRFNERKGTSNGHLFFMYHGDNPKGLKEDLEREIGNKGLDILPIKFRNPGSDYRRKSRH